MEALRKDLLSLLSLPRKAFLLLLLCDLEYRQAHWGMTCSDAPLDCLLSVSPPVPPVAELPGCPNLMNAFTPKPDSVLEMASCLILLIWIVHSHLVPGVGSPPGSSPTGLIPSRLIIFSDLSLWAHVCPPSTTVPESSRLSCQQPTCRSLNTIIPNPCFRAALPPS